MAHSAAVGLVQNAGRAKRDEARRHCDSFETVLASRQRVASGLRLHHPYVLYSSDWIHRSIPMSHHYCQCLAVPSLFLAPYEALCWTLRRVTSSVKSHHFDAKKKDCVQENKLGSKGTI